ncbi:hypothetical protein RHGRI_019337 [Rhododendron griersonianum]|uniref:Phytocyanin domain-containing protein n=1 Tax=Rhododendron griersonianum TaxID=479676 RepID=A0AAV6JC30_9ERIC|nr:hypothetical protein RHGRI_019337 [Rhododendron griersonianum]
MAMAMAMAAVLLLFVLAAPAVVHSLQYNVTWNLGINYNSWAAGKTFTVGDTLVFTYTTEHAVDVVDQSEYASCNSWNALHSYTGGQTAISLATPGPMYFLCPIQGHCQAGMKLGITVVAAAASPTAPTTTPPPTSTTTPKPPASTTTRTAPPPTSTTTLKPPPPASTTTPTSTPSPSPSISPSPTIKSPSGSPSSGPSPTISTTPVITAAASSPKSSSGAGGMIGNMGSLVSQASLFTTASDRRKRLNPLAVLFLGNPENSSALLPLDLLLNNLDNQNNNNGGGGGGWSDSFDADEWWRNGSTGTRLFLFSRVFSNEDEPINSLM